MNQYLDVVIKNVTLENSSVKIFELSSVTESKLPVFSAGSHIDIHISDGVIRQYSIINEPETNVDKYLIAVKREKNLVVVLSCTQSYMYSNCPQAHVQAGRPA